MVFARAGALVAATVAVAASLLLTGALHEDGLADTADALGGGATRDRIFAILKDSRIGTFGAAALASTMLLRVAALARIGSAAPAALVLSQAVSRVAPTVLLAALPYVTESASSKSGAVATAGGAQASVAVVLALAVAAGLAAHRSLSPTELIASLAAASLATAIAGMRFRARAGGVTGDFLGAAQQLADCAILLTLAVVRGGGA
jgi:adenosylcobinamide-GDP ribazoletransferase